MRVRNMRLALKGEADFVEVDLSCSGIAMAFSALGGIANFYRMGWCIW